MAAADDTPPARLNAETYLPGLVQPTYGAHGRTPGYTMLPLHNPESKRLMPRLGDPTTPLHERISFAAAPVDELGAAVGATLDEATARWLTQAGQPVPERPWRDYLALTGSPHLAPRSPSRRVATDFFVARFCLAARADLDREAGISAAAAKVLGASWDTLGTTIGMTRQGVQQRWGRRSDITTDSLHERALLDESRR